MDCALQLFEHRQGSAMQGAAGRGKEDCAIAPLEQLHPQGLFQQAHLTADGAMGDVQ
ncbi:hypothetical protein D3C76_1529890 [compost metagenome]